MKVYGDLRNENAENCCLTAGQCGLGKHYSKVFVPVPVCNSLWNFGLESFFFFFRHNKNLYTYRLAHTFWLKAKQLQRVPDFDLQSYLVK